MNKELIEYLSGFVTESRMNTFYKVLESRTRHITVVLEDLYQMHNTSAVLRTCDCFGIQDVHVIENKNTFEANTEISLGASKWLTLHKHDRNKKNTRETCNELRKNGYKIVATIPGKGAKNLEEYNISEKTALLFGTELTGLSDEMLSEADDYLKIPMFGFTGSFNVSVSAGIILHFLTYRLHESNLHWKLTENEKELILLEWLKITIKNSGMIMENFFKEKNSNK
ncbi:MAG: TrmH family RNA methyltransferase [Bacteroidales bacterium]